MNLFDNEISSKNTEIFLPILKEKNISLCIKREDLLHEFVSGNKFRKLKYNIQEAKKQQKKTVVTFGGAYSNHIAATAAACRLNNLESIGIIRGEELNNDITATLSQNTTLKTAHQNGMAFDFVSRDVYRQKDTESFISELKNKYGTIFIVPEGGTNKLAIKGCEEILSDDDFKFDYVCSAAGTGGTIAGIINSLKKHQRAIAFSALKGDFLQKKIESLTNNNNWELQTNYHFGGYAKYNEELIDFINYFKSETDILLDPIYTGKMIFGIINLATNDFFPENSRILAIHTGGLQGIHGINQKLKKQEKKQIIL